MTPPKIRRDGDTIFNLPTGRRLDGIKMHVSVRKLVALLPLREKRVSLLEHLVESGLECRVNSCHRAAVR